MRVGQLIFLPLFVAAAGCATLTKPFSGGVSAQHKARTAATTQQLSDHRDTAEFQAAQDLWSRQDLAGCREQLQQLLTRNPKFTQARLLMADVLLASNQPQEAVLQIKEALKQSPKDPDVQYAMALTLDATGAHAESLPYYERAAKACPENDVYGLSYRTARGGRETPQGPRREIAVTGRGHERNRRGPPAAGPGPFHGELRTRDARRQKRRGIAHHAWNERACSGEALGALRCGAARGP